MSENRESLVDHMEKVLKLPRENGELIFRTQWESRIFGMAVLLFEKGEYTWKSFNEQFVKEIEAAESQDSESELVSTYYHRWLQAFEKLLIEKKTLTSEQLKIISDQFQSGERNHVC